MEPIVIARAPGHLSLGWDEPPAAAGVDVGERQAICAAISTYAYTIVSPCSANDVRISVAGCHTLPWYMPQDAAWGGELTLPRAILRLFGTREGLSIFLSTQAPVGIGLGLAGSLAVSMIKALAFSCGLDLDPREVAELACSVGAEAESPRSTAPCQYAAASGGLSWVGMSDGRLKATPIRTTLEARHSLAKHLMLFGQPCATHPLDREGEDGAAEGVPESAVAAYLTASQNENRRARAAIERGDWAELGDLLERGWRERNRLVGMDADNPLSQGLSAARAAGAYGGKGTGRRGGLLMLLCPDERQDAVTEAMDERDLRRLPLTLEMEGVQVMEAVPHTKFLPAAPAFEPAFAGGQAFPMR